LVQDRCQKLPGSRAAQDIARSELHAQTQTASPLAGEDRSIGSLAVASLGDIPHGGTFLRA
jgi:hypothetical protein